MKAAPVLGQVSQCQWWCPALAQAPALALAPTPFLVVFVHFAEERSVLAEHAVLYATLPVASWTDPVALRLQLALVLALARVQSLALARAPAWARDQQWNHAACGQGRCHGTVVTVDLVGQLGLAPGFLLPPPRTLTACNSSRNPTTAVLYLQPTKEQAILIRAATAAVCGNINGTPARGPPGAIKGWLSAPSAPWGI